MIKRLRNAWLFSAEELLQSLIIILVTWMLGMGMVLVVVKIAQATGDTDNTYALMGSFMAYLCWIMIDIWVGMVACGKHFGLMVSMSRTRKEFLGTYILTGLINNSLKMGTILVLYQAEHSIADWLYPGMTRDLDMGAFLWDYRLIVGTILLTLALRLLTGGLYLKFQMKVFWVIWALFMLAGALMRMVPNMIENGGETGRKIVDILQSGAAAIVSAGMAAHLGIIVAMFLILTGIARLLLKKQAVVA